MGYPDLAFPETPDAIDDLIAALNDAVGDVVTFERDVLDVERPEDWGAVELVDVVNEYADGKIIDQMYIVDIWASVSDRSSQWLREIESVLASFGDKLRYSLTERAYLHDLKKVMWRWRGELWSLAPAVPAAGSGTEKTDPTSNVPVQQEDNDLDDLPFTDPEEDPEDPDTWPDEDEEA